MAGYVFVAKAGAHDEKSLRAMDRHGRWICRRVTGQGAEARVRLPVDVVRECQADLIVTGERSRLSPTRILGGSVSRQIRAMTDCALHVVC